jgi:hypothetical protein
MAAIYSPTKESLVESLARGTQLLVSIYARPLWFPTTTAPYASTSIAPFYLFFPPLFLLFISLLALMFSLSKRLRKKPPAAWWGPFYLGANSLPSGCPLLSAGRVPLPSNARSYVCATRSACVSAQICARRVVIRTREGRSLGAMYLGVTRVGAQVGSNNCALSMLLVKTVLHYISAVDRKK